MNRSSKILYKDGQRDGGGCSVVEWGEGVDPSQLGPEVLFNIAGGCSLEVSDSKRLRNLKEGKVESHSSGGELLA